MTLTEKSQKIKHLCKQLGFDQCGIVRLTELTDQKQHLDQWLKNNYNGEMEYMRRNLEKRLDPRLLVPNAKSAIVVLLNYYPRQKLKLKKYKISKYAYGTDYHFVIKKRLWKLLQMINQQIEPANGRPLVDSAPVLERALAQKAGLGWIGKNSMLITRKGSYFFIGELFVDIELAYDTPFTKNFCGNCTACIDACPTKAIVKPYVVDARRCISYLTIEKRGPFDQPVNLNGWIFGCDICQDVCPWNKKPIPTTLTEFSLTEQLLNLTDNKLETLDKQSFKRIFKHTPLMRAKYEGIMRNIKANQSKTRQKPAQSND